MQSASFIARSVSLSFVSISLSLSPSCACSFSSYRFRCRLNDGLVADFFRLNAHCFAACSSYLPVNLSLFSSACYFSSWCIVTFTSGGIRPHSRLSPTECSLSFAFCLTLFRLNCGFVAGFLRLYAFSLQSLICFLFISPLSFLLTLSLPVAMSVSLRTKLRLPNRLSPTECIRLHCSLSFAFCLTLFRLNYGFVAGFLRLNAFGAIAPSHLLSV
jgi:hypothetical protein